jgi:hypothetical protein
VCFDQWGECRINSLIPDSVYRAAVQRSGRLAPGPIFPDHLDSIAGWSECPDVTARFVEALREWSGQWHLPCSGFLWIALQTMYFWLETPSLVRRRWLIIGPIERPAEGRPFQGAVPVSFAVGAWHPQAESRAAARRRIMTELEAQVERHLEDVAIDFQTPGVVFSEGGAVPAPVKQDLSHFDWFVRHQVKGESFSQIGRQADYHRTAVKRAVDHIGTLLDGERWPTWRRQPEKGGRPRRMRP